MFEIAQVPVYTKDQLSKIGNAIVFLCNKLGDIPKTKLLKLIYLIEEQSISTYGMPFFNVNFKIWHLGPVEPDLFAEFSDSPYLLSDYIKLKQTEKGTFISVSTEFNDDEFSRADMNILQDVLDNFGNKTGKQLVNITHKKGSPWFLSAERFGLLELFDKRSKNISDKDVDLLTLIENDPDKLSNYKRHKEFLCYSASLNS